MKLLGTSLKSGNCSDLEKTVDFRRCSLGTHERHAPPSGESCYCAAGSSAKTERVRTTISVFWGAKTSHSGARAPVRDPSQKHRQNSGNTQNHENPPGTFFLTDLVSYQLNFHENPSSLQMLSNQHLLSLVRRRLLRTAKNVARLLHSRCYVTLYFYGVEAIRNRE